MDRRRFDTNGCFRVVQEIQEPGTRVPIQEDCGVSQVSESVDLHRRADLMRLLRRCSPDFDICVIKVSDDE
jgi:hypothetical protein